MQEIKLLPDRTVQDYRSTYNDIRDWLRREKSGKEAEESTIDWDDVVFEVDLFKSQEINLDYILELIFEHNKKTKDKIALIEEIRRIIRASPRSFSPALLFALVNVLLPNFFLDKIFQDFLIR